MWTFTASGFRVAIPDDWVDRSVYTFRGPVEGDHQHVLAVVPDPGSRAPSVEDYARRRIDIAVKSLPGTQVLVQEPLELARGLGAWRAELRWFPADGLRLYQRLLYVLARDVGFTLAVQRTKKSRLTHGPAIDRMLSTFRPLDVPPGRGPQTEGATPFVAPSFSLSLAPGWSDETIYALGQSDTSRFCRTLIVTREGIPEAPPSTAAIGAAGIDAMRGKVPGFELESGEEIEAQDGAPAFRIRFRRKTDQNGTVAQDQLLAWRAGLLFTLTLTTEPEPPAKKQRVLVEITPSFAALPA